MGELIGNVICEVDLCINNLIIIRLINSWIFEVIVYYKKLMIIILLLFDG